MATIRYELRSKKSNASIYLRFSVKRGLLLYKKTGLQINSKDWSENANLPKQTTAGNKKLIKHLKKLEGFIYDSFNNSIIENETINANWLSLQMDIFFGRVNKSGQSEFLTDALNNLINNSKKIKSSRGGLGLSKSREYSYLNLLKKITDFQKGKPLKIKDISYNWGQTFCENLINHQKYSLSTVKKIITDLKAVCNNAEKNGIEINPQTKSIGVVNKQKNKVIYLNNEEIKKVKNTYIKNKSLNNIKKWLLIGCLIGQRGSDLLKLNKNYITTLNNGTKAIAIKQKKTGNQVIIPISKEFEKLVSTGYPYQVSLRMFNMGIKKVCELSGINKPITGYLMNPKTRRKEKGLYPKYALIGSHVCRRSFASNLYGEIATQVIMSTTGHSTEEMLLKYIGKTSEDHAETLLKHYEKKEANLKIVKRA